MSKDSSIKVFAENASGTRPANAIPVWIDNISAIGGGGSEFDPTYMSAQIDNKLNKSEVGFRKWGSLYYVSAISGKEISARYAVTAQNANTATTAIYDENGNYLTDTYNNLTALNEFVRTNSANWEGGSSSTNDVVIFRLNGSQEAYVGNQSFTSYVSGASDLYFSARYEYGTNPGQITIFQNGSMNFVNLSLNSSDGEYDYYTGRYYGQPNSEYELRYNGNPYNYCVVSANGVNTDVISQGTYECTPDKVAKFNLNGNNVTGSIDGYKNGMSTMLTSFTGNLTDFTAKGYERYDCITYYDDDNYSYNYDLSAEFDAGSTVASSDVFPPTNNLDPYATYYLGWNANNGGLFWYQPGNN